MQRDSSLCSNNIAKQFAASIFHSLVKPGQFWPVCLVLLLITAMPLNARCQSVPLSKKANAAKRKVESLAPDAKISVVFLQSPEEFGTFTSSTEEGFSFHDVDTKQNVTVRYAEISKVKNGYGGYNFVHQRHTDRTKSLIAVGSVLVVLAVLVGVAAATL